MGKKIPALFTKLPVQVPPEGLAFSNAKLLTELQALSSGPASTLVKGYWKTCRVSKCKQPKLSVTCKIYCPGIPVESIIGFLIVSEDKFPIIGPSH